MTTQVVFNANSIVKKKAMARSKKMGMPLSFVLNKAITNFAEGRWDVDIVEEKFNAKTAREITKALEDFKAGKNISPVFNTIKDALDYYKL